MTTTQAILWSIPIVLALLALALIISKTGWRPNHIRWGWIIGTIVVFLIGWGIISWISSANAKAKADQEARAEHARTNPPPAKITVEFPFSGEGHATKEAGIKAYLDPRRTFTRPSGPARYVFANDPVLFFDDTEGHKVDRTKNRKAWQEMPEGNYIVYPLDRNRIWFKWW